MLLEPPSVLVGCASSRSGTVDNSLYSIAIESLDLTGPTAAADDDDEDDGKERLLLGYLQPSL